MFRQSESKPTPLFAQNLNIAKEVIKEIKAKVTSSHDIISRLALPFMHGDEIEQYKAKFGEKVMNESIRHMKMTSIVRAVATKSPELAKVKCPLTTAQIAITECGLGECSETSNLAALKLIEKGCKNVHLIGIKGMPRIGGIQGDYYDHAFVLVGDISPLDIGSALSDFDKLDKNCVLVDPLLGIAGPAHQFNTLLKDYLAIYKMKSIFAINDVPDGIKNEIQEIKATAKSIADQMKLFGLEYHKPVAETDAKSAMRMR